MAEETKKKTNFFKQVFKSIKDLDKYEDFATELPKVAFKYLFKLVLVFTIIITLVYSYKIVSSLNEMYSNLKDIIPNFSYSEGVLTVDSKEPIVIKQYEESIGKIIIDTNIDENEIEEYEKEIKNSSLLILVLKDKFIISTEDAAGQVMYNHKDITNSYQINEFTKQDIINYIEGMNIVSIYTSIYFVMFMYLFIIYFISILIDVLILSILAYLISRISRIRLKYAPVFNIAVHSITLPILLNLIYIVINLLTGFNIKYFQFMYNTVSYIYVIVAILMIKTDFINRQIELIKLAEEQEKVREELNKQKEEKEKQEKEPTEEKQNEKKEKKKEEGNLDEGVNPSVIQEKQ